MLIYCLNPAKTLKFPFFPSCERLIQILSVERSADCRTVVIADVQTELIMVVAILKTCWWSLTDCRRTDGHSLGHADIWIFVSDMGLGICVLLLRWELYNLFVCLYFGYFVFCGITCDMHLIHLPLFFLLMIDTTPILWPLFQDSLGKPVPERHHFGFYWRKRW